MLIRGLRPLTRGVRRDLLKEGYGAQELELVGCQYDFMRLGSTVHCIYVCFPYPNPGENPGQFLANITGPVA